MGFDQNPNGKTRCEISYPDFAHLLPFCNQDVNVTEFFSRTFWKFSNQHIFVSVIINDFAHKFPKPAYNQAVFQSPNPSVERNEVRLLYRLFQDFLLIYHHLGATHHKDLSHTGTKQQKSLP